MMKVIGLSLLSSKSLKPRATPAPERTSSTGAVSRHFRESFCQLTMTYEPDDVTRLFTYLAASLASPTRGATLLRTAVADGEELAAALGQYPVLRVGPLDFHYVCLQSLGALDERLVADLTCCHGRRGIQWAAILAMLSPNPAYLPYLRAALPSSGRYRWLVELSLDLPETRDDPVLREYAAATAAFGQQLASLPWPAVVLRAVPADAVLLARTAAVRAAYHNAGRDAALDVIKSQRVREHARTKP
jgi:hypothetical protein